MTIRVTGIMWLLLASIASAARGDLITSTATVTAGGYEGVRTDAFDLSQGAVIESWTHGTYYDPYGGPVAILGGPGLLPGEFGHTLFGDGFLDGTVFRMQFVLPEPIWLGSIKLGLSQDGELTRRGAAAYSLSVEYSDGTPERLVSYASLASDYVQAYGDATITVSDSFAPVQGQQFVFTVTQRGPMHGPRVFELDGFTAVAPVPEPSTWALGMSAVALGVMRVIRRRRTARPNGTSNDPT